MNKIFFIMLFILIYFKVNLRAQNDITSCPNSNFSEQNFNHWTGCYGTFDYPCMTSGFASNRHTLITTPGVDPNTCGGLQMIPPGVNQVVRLGNSSVNAQAERMEFEIFVDTNINGLFVYKYAVVLEDPDDGYHAPNEMPKFEIRVIDQNGIPSGDTCAHFVYYVGMPGYTPYTCNVSSFQVVRWFDWRTIGLSLKSYHGQNIKIQFTTYDCALGAHFGYAYFTTQCLPRRLTVKYCQGDSIIELTAPYGFQYNWSPGGYTSQTITVNNPIDSTIYTCVLTSPANTYCIDTLRAIILPASAYSAFTFNNGCMGSPVQFVHNSTFVNGTDYGWYWNFGDPGSANNIANTVDTITHTFQNSGTYTVTLIDTMAAGCNDTITHDVFISPQPNIVFTPNATPTCKGIVVSADNNSTNFTTIQWMFSNNYSSIENHAETIYNYGTDSAFISLIVQNTYCKDTLEKAIPLNFTGKINLPPPNVFTPNSDGINDCYKLETAPEMANCYKMTIFNRWGLKVYEKDDSHPCWNGKNKNGKPMHDGVYYYIIEVGETTYKGIVHLIGGIEI